MPKYTPTIGLEVHAELKTRTKMFCDSPNDPDETRPNQNVCPVCLAHPGTLPTINEEAVRHVLRLGTAINGTVAGFTEFDRKSYFYPDIPKGYQISQYAYPLVSGGTLAGVPITRVHLEEDTARSTHAGGKSLVDFNRAGVPLMELVTEPAIHDAETAGNFARELQLLLRTLGASDAHLEKGEMRIEVNISVSADETFGTKVEIKNLNSFRSVERAIAHEIERQTALLERGEKVAQETWGWDETKQSTFRQRSKEGSADYRYFPEPDLPKLILSDIPVFASEALAASLPELPWQRRERYAALGIKDTDAKVVSALPETSAFFDSYLSEVNVDKELVTLGINYLISDLGGSVGNISPNMFAKVMQMIKSNELSSRGAKDLLAILQLEGGDPVEVSKERGLIQVSDTGALQAAVRAIIAREVKVVEEYRGGKEAALQYLVGQGMKETKGAGNPALIRKILIEEMG